MSDLITGGLGSSTLITEGLGGDGSPLSASFGGLYNPMISLLVAPEDPLLLSDTDDDLPVKFTCTADDENGAVVDWLNNTAYAVASIVLYVVSVNNPLTFANAAFPRTIDPANITPTTTTLTFKYLFMQADVVLLPNIVYQAFAKVTLVNGECRTFGQVEINMRR